VTPDGVVKLLDFGLAKAFNDTAQTPVSTAASAPTLISGETGEGVILGTAAYMSPEQARGKPTDRRADIWSFGVVLYELLTGRRPFSGSDVSETLASILRDEPQWNAADPRALRLLRKCLAKESRERLRDIGDASALLDDAAHTPGVSS